MQVRALSEERAGRRSPVKRDSLLDLIGRTPLVRLNRVTSELSPGVEVWAKLELFNPGGSVKDRTARQIVTDAIERGDLADGRRLLDATSGNTGIAYAMLGAALDFGVTVVMPENALVAHRRLIERYGGEIVHSSPTDGDAGAISLAREIATEHPDEFWFADQYANPSNPRAHELTTAPEIWAQTAGLITHFVASVGTSGTVIGTGRGLKQFNPAVQIIECQPADAVHGLEGLTHVTSDNAPAIYQSDELDGSLRCETDEGLTMARRLAHEEGLAAGHSAGTNVWAALRVAADLESGVVVTVICDHADRYLSE